MPHDILSTQSFLSTDPAYGSLGLKGASEILSKVGPGDFGDSELTT